jgi:very-short-patch-repair endonuclease
MSTLEDMLVFHLRASKLPEPVREYQFATSIKRRWRFDFAWPDLCIGVEVEGGVYSGGRHTRGAGFEKDCEKYNEAVILGWSVLRFTGSMIHSGIALATITRLMQREAANG